MKVLFQCEQLNYRGTTNSVYDYALYNQEILGNESIIALSSSDPGGIDTASEAAVIQKFSKKFQLLKYDSNEHLNQIASSYDFCYSQRAGLRTDMKGIAKLPIVDTTRFGVHCVFQWYDPHGDVYAYISNWLSNAVSKLYNAPVCPHVPYIVDLPEPNYNLREAIGIPKNKLVFGRHGGFSTFDIPFVKKVVQQIVSERDDIVFLFLNTEKFMNHPNVIHINPTADKQMISNFVNACDAMLHGRELGESFGLAISEFLFFNKPVLAWDGGFDRNHVEMLKDYDCLYGVDCVDDKECYNMIVNFRDRPQQNFKNIVEPFTPKNVMEKFRETFLDPSPTLGNP